jgi:hypothetical protein
MCVTLNLNSDDTILAEILNVNNLTTSKPNDNSNKENCYNKKYNSLDEQIINLIEEIDESFDENIDKEFNRNINYNNRIFNKYYIDDYNDFNIGFDIFNNYLANSIFALTLSSIFIITTMGSTITSLISKINNAIKNK